MRKASLILTLALLLPAVADACLHESEMENMSVYLVSKTTRMAKLCNFCLKEPLLKPKDIKIYDPKTGLFTLTKIGEKNYKARIKKLGGKKALLGRRFAFVCQGRVAISGPFVSETMSRSITRPVILIENKQFKIDAAYPQLQDHPAALPTPDNLKRAILYKQMQARLEALITARLKKQNGLAKKETKALCELALESPHKALFDVAPLAIALAKDKAHGLAPQTLHKLFKNSRSDNQKWHAAVALTASYQSRDPKMIEMFRAALKGQFAPSRCPSKSSESALSLALLNHKASLKELRAQFKREKNPDIELAARYLEINDKLSSPYIFGSFN